MADNQRLTRLLQNVVDEATQADECLLCGNDIPHKEESSVEIVIRDHASNCTIVDAIVALDE